MNKPAPPDFTVPAHLMPRVQAVYEAYAVLADAMIADLQEAGLPSDQAKTVAVDWLVTRSCEVAMDLAISEGREPKAERWQAVTLDTFERVLKRRQPIVLDARFVL